MKGDKKLREVNEVREDKEDMDIIILSLVTCHLSLQLHFYLIDL